MKKKPSKKPVKLPSKPSALILLALKDLRAVERMKSRYTVSMDAAYHEPDYYADGKCVVCFAGSVMAKTLGTPLDKGLHPTNAGRWNGKRLFALDRFRSGEVACGAKYMGLPHDLFKNRTVADYCDDPDQFHVDMAKLAADFAAIGL